MDLQSPLEVCGQSKLHRLTSIETFYIPQRIILEIIGVKLTVLPALFFRMKQTIYAA